MEIIAKQPVLIVFPVVHVLIRPRQGSVFVSRSLQLVVVIVEVVVVLSERIVGV